MKPFNYHTRQKTKSQSSSQVSQKYPESLNSSNFKSLSFSILLNWAKVEGVSKVSKKESSKSEAKIDQKRIRGFQWLSTVSNVKQTRDGKVFSFLLKPSPFPSRFSFIVFLLPQFSNKQKSEKKNKLRKKFGG